MTNRAVYDFDQHAPRYRERSHEIYAEMRASCPVAWTESNGGFWVATSYDAMATIARDDITFSSAHEPDGSPKQGVSIPPNPALPGMLETDPPLLAALRRAVNPWLSPAAVDRLRPAIERYTRWCIDGFIQSGRGDLVLDLASPLPAMITMTAIGLPLADWKYYSDAIHGAIYTPPGAPEHAAAAQGLRDAVGRIMEVSAARREDPQDDMISMLTALEVDGEQLSLEVVAGNVFNVIGGGVDTTTGLIANSLLHLAEHPEARDWLRQDPTRLAVACEEYLRYFAPVPGLARTVTAPCVVGGQQLEQWDRVWLSWASANLDPAQFDDPEEIRLDRFPNRHAAFGLGAHRCVGSNLARVVWTTAVSAVLRRLPDYVVDTGASRRYPTTGTINGWMAMPISFTAGAIEGDGQEMGELITNPRIEQ